MPPELRILGLGTHLPGAPVPNAELASSLGASADELAERTGIEARHFAQTGEGPSDLACVAAAAALTEAAATPEELGLVVFATTTPDVAFPGAACFLQHKLGVPTVGCLDIRAQAAGFLAALDLAAGFSGEQTPQGDADPRYARVLVAAGEVFASSLDFSERGAELAARLADGAAVAVVGRGESGPKVRAVRWYTDGTLLEKFHAAYPSSAQVPARILAENIEAGEHFPQADLAALEDLATERLAAVLNEVAGEVGIEPGSAARVLVDYVDPRVAERAAAAAGVSAGNLVVPTARYGHVMTAGLALSLADARSELAAGDLVLLAAAGPGFTWGAAALEMA